MFQNIPFYLEFVVVGVGIVLLLAETFSSSKNKRTLALFGALSLSLVTLFLTFVVINPDNIKALESQTPEWISSFYSLNKTSIFFKILALISTILTLLLSFDYSKTLNRYTCPQASSRLTGEFYSLPLFTCAGFMWLASANNFVSLFISLELVTISFYVMVTYMRRNIGSLEAGVKYLILGALSTGFLVYGLAWVYGMTGVTSIPDLADNINYSPALLFGLALLIISLAFKIGAAPMQLWIPDVYQGAPTPITAFLSVGSKTAGFGAAITLIYPFLLSKSTNVPTLIALLIITAATLLYGNLAVLAQQNFKRLLAYSSISHAGFILIPFILLDFQSLAFYLITYLIMTFSAFFILAVVQQKENDESLEAFNGLYRKNPFLALCLTITMASMAGLPLTAGFMGKFLVFKAALTHISIITWPVFGIALIAAITGFYYYFKIIASMFWKESKSNTCYKEIPVLSKCLIGLLSLAILIIGAYPKSIQSFILLF